VRHAIWNDQAELLNQPLAAALMDLRREDGDNDLLMDAVQMWEITECADKLLAIDGILTPYNRLEKVAVQIESVMKRASGEIKPVSHVVSDPFIQLGVLQVAVVFTLSDEQTVTVYFHNPDTTPKKIQATDELISWKWLLNKKDVTILVAPEQGKELDAREVAKRVMKAAEKNSKSFIRNNAKSAERQQSLDVLTAEIAGLETECKGLEKQIAVAKIAAEDAAAVVPVAPVVTPESTPALEAEPVIINGTELGEFPDTPEGLKALRAAARQHLLDMRGEMIDCPAIGGQVEIRKRGIKETMAFSGNPKKLKLIPAIKSLIRSAVEAEWEGNAKPEKKPDVLGYYLIKSIARLEGEAVKVDLLIEKDKQGNLYYDLLVDRPQTKAALDSSSAVSASKHSPDNNSGYLDNLNLGALPDGVKLDSASGSDLVLNLFIEGEEPEAVEDTPADDSTPLPVTESAPKEPWQMTLKEWLKTASIMRGDTVAGRLSDTGVVVPKYGDIKLPASVDRVPVYVTDLKNKRISDGKILRGLHSRIVEETVRKGIAVPLEVLADYPWLLHPDGSQVKEFTLPYKFASATYEFKRWVANSVNKESYSPFATAKAMDEAAIRNGASIEWGAFNGATFDSIYIDDDGEEDDDDDIFDSSDHWKQQPRNRQSGRWELRRGKRIKGAAKDALHALGRAASRANSYVSQALNGGNKHSHSSSGALAAVGHAGAELDPSAAAMGELLGSIRSVTRVLDSVIYDVANDANYNPNTDGYIGRVIKDGEFVGRINLADNGEAMVYVGADGNQQASKDGSKGSYLRDRAAAQLIDWLFVGLNGEQGSGDDAPLANDKPSKALTNIQNTIARLDSIYTFNATPQFKEWVAGYLDAPAPNPFITAKAMNEDAIRNGVSIDWGFFEGAVKNPAAGRSGSLFDAIKDEVDPFKREEDGIDIHGYNGMVIDDGVVIGRIDIYSDGEAMVFVGHASDQHADEGEEDTQVTRPNGLPIEDYSVEDAPYMVGWLVQQLATPHSVNALGEKPLSYLMNGKGKAIIGKVVSDGVSFDIYAEGAGTFVKVGLKDSDSIDNPVSSDLNYTTANEAVKKLLDEFDKNALFTLNDPNAVAQEPEAETKKSLEPWQMTRKQYQAQQKKINANANAWVTGNSHEIQVAIAAGQGKDVPQINLDRYPDIEEHPQYRSAREKLNTQSASAVPESAAPTKGRMGLDDVLRVATLQGRSGNAAFHVYRKVDDAEASKIKQATGVDVSGFEHGIDEAAIRHVLKEHGDMETENARGQSAITQEDFKRLDDLTDPLKVDSIERGHDDNGAQTVVYKTKENGHVFVVEEARSGRNRLALKTMWKTRSAPRTTLSEGVAHTSETFGAQSPTGAPSLVQPSENNKSIGDGSPESVKFIESLSQSDDLNDPDVSAQLNVFTWGKFNLAGTPDAYTKATRILLEGSLKVPVPRDRHVRIVNDKVDQNANIVPQTIDKKVKPAASVAERLSVAMTLAGKDDVRQQLNGVLVQEGRLVACDGHRMIIHETDTSALIASHTVNNNGELIISRNGGLVDDVGKYYDYNRVIPEVKATDTVVVIDAKKLAARVRGVIKAAKFFFRQDVPIALEFDGFRAAFSAKYLLDIAETFLQLGYGEFTIYFKADEPKNALLAVSADDKVKQALMPRLHINDTNSNLFKPIGDEVVVNSGVAMPTEAAAPVANNSDEALSFLESVVTGNVDFYDKAVTDRLESLAKTVSDPAMTALIKQAKKVVKVFFNAEFKKKAK